MCDSPKELDEDRVAELVQQARDFAVVNGILMVPKDAKTSNHLGHAPFTLFPSRFPEQLFQQALAVQNDFNLLMDKVSRDYEFIRTSLQSVIKFDDFTKRLVEIQDIVVKEGVSQKISLGLFRSDYMMNPTQHGENSARDFEIKQIEINTIAASFAGLGSKMPHLHRYIEQMYRKNSECLTEQMPDNGAIAGLASGIAKAWSLYNKKSAVVLIVVPEGETNRIDQRMMEYNIRQCNPVIRTVFKTLGEIDDQCILDEDKHLLLDGKEVAVAYFRSGYSPTHFRSEKEWSSRLKLERCRAIKCPSVLYQLVGTKKIQQVLAKPGTLERFLDDPDQINRIRNTFAGLYSLDVGEEGDENAEMAKAKPELYVVKPQREGGGNNIFGQDIVKLLESNDDSRTQYILMEKVNPPVFKNYIVQLHKTAVEQEDVVCELGIFGVVISDGESVVRNETVGHLLRTKSTIHEDGGVAALRAVLDSPYLI